MPSSGVGPMYEVILADNQELYRAGIVELLSSHDEFRIVAQPSDWSLLLAALIDNWKSLIIASTSLVHELQELMEGARVARSRVLLIIEDSDSPLRYRSIGVAGIVQRSTSGSALLESLRRIQRGNPGLAGGRSPNEDGVGALAAASLTVIELRLVALLMKGFKNKRIAECLGMSDHAIRSRFQKIFDKTGLSTRLELALFVAQHRAFESAATDTYASLEASSYLRICSYSLT